MNNVEKLINKKMELEEIEKEDRRVWKEIREIAQGVTPEQLTSLGYDRAKGAYRILLQHVSEERGKELSAALRKLELKEHPESEGAVWFPEINEIPCLTLEEKYLLDEAVSHYRVGEFIDLSCQLMKETGISKEHLKTSAEFLSGKGVLCRHYCLGCRSCGEYAFYGEDIIQELLNGEIRAYCTECEKDIFEDKEELRAQLEGCPEAIYRVEKQPRYVPWR